MFDQKEAEKKFAEFMRELGIEPEDDEHLNDTPRRVVSSRYNELFKGLQENPRRHLKTTFEEGVDDDFVIVDNINVQSMCAHHWLSIRGNAHVGYIPDGKVVGLSKIARVVNGYARRPQVQERLTKQIADAVHEELQPKAVVVSIRAVHDCMSLRGIEEPNSQTSTVALRGKAREEEHIKDEFFDRVNGL